MQKYLFTLALSASVAVGQTMSDKQLAESQTVVRIAGPNEFGPIGIVGAMAGPQTNVAGAPYSAEAVTQHIQVLADGNRIVQTTSGSVARDSQGRVRRDETLPSIGTAGGDAPHLVMIDDPVAGLHWTLEAESKTAIKMPFAPGKTGPLGVLPAPPPGARAWFVSGGTPPPPGQGGPVVQYQIRTRDTAPDANVSKTDLGMQIIEGVMAQGTRLTRTIPAGAVGNEQSITITTETWYSPDLKVLIQSKSIDPRMGETSYKLTNISRSEPAPNLFQAPADYTVKDQASNALFIHNLKLKDEKSQLK